MDRQRELIKCSSNLFTTSMLLLCSVQNILRCYLSARLERDMVIDSVAHHIGAVGGVLDENGVCPLSVHGAAPHHRQLAPGVNLTCGEAKS